MAFSIFMPQPILPMPVYNSVRADSGYTSFADSGGISTEE